METVRSWLLVAGILSVGFWWCGCSNALADNPAVEMPPMDRGSTFLKIQVNGSRELFKSSVDGRLLVALGRNASPEPRNRIGETGMEADPLLGRDVVNFDGSPVPVGDGAALFPLRELRDLSPGDYWAQAVLLTNRDLRLISAPGNFFSEPTHVKVVPDRPITVDLTLNQKQPEEHLPADTNQLRFIKFRSERLSRFYGRSMYLRAGVVLPQGWTPTGVDRYPFLIIVGGFGSRFDGVQHLMGTESGFRKAWLEEKAPRFVAVHLDGAGPNGDPYQINSDNNGPYGDAVVYELIPFLETTFHGVGTGASRVTTGGSTGGWVSLALQVFYPDEFAGCWSGFPDSPDFRAFQSINLYADRNAYVNRFGFERPSKRDPNGEVEFTVRHECQLENVLGSGNQFTESAGQWGSWNAVYGPRGLDGRPVPAWHPRTGTIDPAVQDHWRKYDLRMILERDWKTLAPRLRGKIHIWVGDSDDYFLDAGARLLETFLRTATPPAEARVEFGPRQRHGWQPRTWNQLLDEMDRAVVKGR
jgi:hypothetical protein